MGALLERHGIGNGKYKVGGSYPNSILLDDPSLGRGQVLYQYTETDANRILQSVEIGEEGNFYIGSRAGSSNLFKLSSTGTLLWQSNIPASVTHIQYDGYDDLIWVYDATNNNVSSYDLSGNQLLTIPYAFSNFLSMQVTEQYLILSNFGNTGGTVTSVTIYEKSGASVRSLSLSTVRTMKVIENDLYVADNARLRKYNLNLVQQWELPIIASTVNTTKAELIRDYDGNIIFYNYNSGTPGQANLYVVNDSDGSLIRSGLRNNTNIISGTNDDYPLVNTLFMINNNQSNPLIISTETGTGVVLRYINESLKITSRRTTGVTTAPLTIRTKPISISPEFNVAYIANKAMYFIDPKEYYKIIK